MTENKKKIEDYLPHYVGCDCEIITAPGTVGKLVSLNIEHRTCSLLQPGMGFMGGGWFAKTNEIKPLLRPLSDMTEEEHNKVAELLGYPKPYRFYKKEWFKWYWEGEGNEMFFAPAYITEVFRYLLSKHFDLFGLIESGLAIDASKIKT